MMSILHFLTSLSEYADVYLFSLDDRESIEQFVKSKLTINLPDRLLIKKISNRILGVKSNKLFFYRNFRTELLKLNKIYTQTIVYSREIKQLVKLGKEFPDQLIAYECHQILSKNLCGNGKFKQARAIRKNERALFTRVNYIFSITPTLKLDVEKTFSFDNLIAHEILPVGVSNTFFNQANTNGCHEYDILYSGGFSPWKGVRTLISAISLIKKSQPKLKALMVGANKEEMVEYGNLIQAMELGQCITLKPKVSHREVISYIKSSKVAVVVVSNQDDGTLYTSPLKLYEYLASGIRTVVARTPAIQSALPEDLVDWVIPDNADSYATQIKKSLSEVDVNAAKRVEFAKHLTWNIRAKNAASWLKKNDPLGQTQRT